MGQHFGSLGAGTKCYYFYGQCADIDAYRRHRNLSMDSLLRTSVRGGTPR
jgi:hypothetical protein